MRASIRKTISWLVVPTFAHRVVLGALLFSIGDVVLAEPAPPTAEDQRLLPYAEPGQLVDIGGRNINLRCSGSGGPTVILMAGLLHWSFVWDKTQPEIANRTRVCAFDRASFGFSDPAPKPEIMADVVNDLHAALHAADVPGPYVLVGHSAGGFEARVFAQKWPGEVAGMVLLDTSYAGQVLDQTNMPSFKGLGFEGEAPAALKCALLAARGPLAPSNPEYESCSRSLPEGAPAALQKVWPRFFTADYQCTHVSLVTSSFTHRYDGADHLHLGDKPLVVLSRAPDRDWPEGEFGRDLRKQWYAHHKALAHLSSRGVHRVIEHSGHDIEGDQPQAVIDAVDEVLRQLHARQKS
jgi:pimeloyl-ACP methyl ester carboxylesterase